jgi:c-di-GMP-binding flagellar brake protein YcgR
MSSIIDKRKAKRSIIRIKVVDAGTDQLIGNTIDLNSTGMLLVSSDEIPMGQAMSVRLEHTFDDRKNITLSAKVVWHMASVKPGVYNAGFYFTDTTPEQTRFINNLIEELAM